jgi:hypothetical protein
MLTIWSQNFVLFLVGAPLVHFLPCLVKPTRTHSRETNVATVARHSPHGQLYDDISVTHYIAKQQPCEMLLIDTL